jgi:hypothetical protein
MLRLSTGFCSVLCVLQDPVTFAFARFALNICLCYTDVPPAYFLSSKVHVLLVSLLKFESELVVGPAVLGLMHLSLLPEMKVRRTRGGTRGRTSTAC